MRIRTFKNQAAQGDLLLRRIEKIPDGVVKQRAENGKFILAHSETGHHHTVLDRPNVNWYRLATTGNNLEAQMISYLEVLDEEALDAPPVDLVHERNFDTHDTIRISVGIYEIRRQREYTPAGFRMVAD